MTRNKTTHKLAVLVSANAEIKRVIPFPIQWEDISSQCILDPCQTYADRIFLTVETKVGRNYPVVFLYDEPQKVLGEVGYVFNYASGRWDRFDVDDWIAENEYVRARGDIVSDNRTPKEILFEAFESTYSYPMAMDVIMCRHIKEQIDWDTYTAIKENFEKWREEWEEMKYDEYHGAMSHEFCTDKIRDKKTSIRLMDYVMSNCEDRDLVSAWIQLKKILMEE